MNNKNGTETQYILWRKMCEFFSFLSIVDIIGKKERKKTKWQIIRLQSM